jgi:triosephosphate isomerase
MHAVIRAFLAEAFPAWVASQARILYGGSVKAGNARSLLGQPDIDGALVGGASLSADDFAAIVDAARGR